jgi:hypothetical protein
MSPEGTFRRLVRIATHMMAHGNVQARCAIEDDFHHFRVTVEARNGKVTAVRTDARRSPNSLCGAAGHQLEELVDMALDPNSSAVLKQTDQFQQCTHQLDLAGLGVAALALDRRSRTYEAIVPDRQGGRTSARLLVDGEPVLDWQVKDMMIEAPSTYQGQSLGSGFTQFTSSLNRDEAEAALVLRRALFVSQGRGVDTGALGDRGPVGGCWAWQPQRASQLRRIPENRHDFSDNACGLLADDDRWLDFLE